MPTQVPVAPPVPTPRKPALPKSYGRPPHFLPDAQEITAALSATLTPEEGAWIATKPTDDPQAYAYYLRARTVLLETIGDLRQAVAYLDTALSLDSTFAGAWAQRGILRLAYISSSGQNADTLSAARNDIDRAAALNPDLPETQLALGHYHLRGHRDYEEAVQHFRRARRLQPSNLEAISAIGNVLLRQGRWDEAVKQFRTVATLDPRRPKEVEHLALVFLLMRRYEEADRYIHRALILDSTRVRPNIFKVQLELKRDGDLRAPARRSRGRWPVPARRGSSSGSCTSRLASRMSGSSSPTSISSCRTGWSGRSCGTGA